MCRKYFRRICVLILLFVISSTLWTEETDFTLPGDERQTFRVGITEFVVPPGTEPETYEAARFSLMLLEDLQSCEIHFFNEQEKIRYQSRIVSEKKLEIQFEQEKLKKEMDTLLFTKEKNNKEKRESLSAALKEKNDYLNYLNNLLSEINIQDSKIIEFVPYTASEHLFPVPIVSYEQISREYNLDLLITGWVEKVEEYFYINIKVWDWSYMDFSLEFETAAVPEKAEVAIAEIGREIKTIVLGHIWADLFVRQNSDESHVFLNDEFVGSGNVRVRNLHPGTYRLNITSRLYYDVFKEVDLTPFITNEVVISLKKKEGEEIRVTSYPDGADVYIDSRWIGDTPITTKRPEPMELMVLKKEGYLDEKVFFDNGMKNLTVFLHPSEIQPETIISDKRDKFYNALGIFALSIPIPLFCWGMSFQSAGGFYMAADSYNFNEMNRFQRETNAFYHAYIGGMVITGSLLINTIIHLVDYIVSGNKLR